MIYLLDVNALIALADRDHIHFEAMDRWFAAHRHEGWATCPLTENGMVRVLSQPNYAGGSRRPADVIAFLSAFKAASASHQFWADDVSLSDATLFRPDFIIGPRQVPGVYLLGLAAHRNGTVVSFDRSMPWQAISNGKRTLVHTPA